MWATLFWSLQFISALSFVFVHYHREQTGLVYMGIAAKLVVGVLLLKAYLTGVINWPIGLGGACFDWTLALLFALELRGRAAGAVGQLGLWRGGQRRRSGVAAASRRWVRRGQLAEPARGGLGGLPNIAAGAGARA